MSTEPEIGAEPGHRGHGLVAGIGEHEGSVRMAYVREPDGIVVSLFEQLG